MSACYATTHKVIIHDGFGRGLQEPSEVISVLHDETIEGAYRCQGRPKSPWNMKAPIVGP